jgi:hypothetical protein
LDSRANFPCDPLQDQWQVMLDLLGRNVQYGVTTLPKCLIPGLILLPLPLVHAAIYFHNEPGRRTTEVSNDKSPNSVEIDQDRVLPQETPSLESMPAQLLPEQSLTFGRVLAQLPGVLDSDFK